MNDLKSRLIAAERSGSWCAYKKEWTSSSAVVKYDRLMHNDSNINVNSLNYGTGEHKISKYLTSN